MNLIKKIDTKTALFQPRRTRKGLLYFCLLSLGAASARAATVTSNATGPASFWSDPASWDTGQVPTAADAVVIRSGDLITVDITTAVAASVTVNGNLKFSRFTHSTLTLAAGDIVVNSGAILDIGNDSSPISAATATLVLAFGSTPGQYGLIVNAGATFTTRGNQKREQTNLVSGASYIPLTEFVRVDSANTGWNVGDRITIGKTTQALGDETETRFITSTNPTTGGTEVFFRAPPVGPPGNGPLNFIHQSFGVSVGARVCNLTRNVMVRSSGTNIAANTSYVWIHPQVQKAHLEHSEFAYLGADVPSKEGLFFAGPGGSGFVVVTGCTFHEGFEGIHTERAIFSTTNVFYKNVRGVHMKGAGGGFVGNSDMISSLESGLLLESTFNSNASNTRAYSNIGDGILIRDGSGGNFVNGQAFSNGANGIRIESAPANTIAGTSVINNNMNSGVLLRASDRTIVRDTQIHTNRGAGIQIEAGGEGTMIFSNSVSINQNGIVADGTGDATITLVANQIHGHNARGIVLNDSRGVLFADGWLGYRSNGNLQSNLAGEVQFNTASPQTEILTLRKSRVNPVTGNATAGTVMGSALLSYQHELAPGVLRIHGDASLSAGKALTLDHDQRLIPSTATAPQLYRGTGHTASVENVRDDAATELITITYNTGIWRVSGSLSGVLRDFGGSVSEFPCPVSNPLFLLNLEESPSVADGDQLSFFLLAGSDDAGQQKQILFGPANSGFNGGRSRLTVAPGASLTLRGAPGTPAIIDQQLSGTTFYTLVSSGALSLHDVQVKNADAAGLRLSGSDGVSLSSASFDFMGVVPGQTAAYITARDLSSNATFYNVSFGLSRSTAATAAAYNVNVLGTDAGLAWYFDSFSGPISGDFFDNDPNTRVLWRDAVPPSAATGFTAAPGATQGAIALSWTSPGDDGNSGPLHRASWRIYHSTDTALTASAMPSQAQLVISTTAAPGSAHGTAVGDLLLANTYYFRLWAADEWNNPSPPADAPPALPLHPQPGAPSVGATLVALEEVQVDWMPSTVPPMQYLDHYELFYSSLSATGPFADLGNISASASSFTHAGLFPETTYYYQLLAVDTGDTRSPPGQASAFTADGTAPEAVTDLSAAPGQATGEVVLTWTSRGDNAGTKALPPGSLHAVEYSADPAYVGWSTATAQVSASAAGAAPGQAQNLTVSGLPPSTIHFFRLWTRDPSGNWSAESNPASALPRQVNPGVLLGAPGASALAVPRAQAFSVRFDKAMQGATVDGAVRLRMTRDRLSQPVDLPAGGTVAYDAPNDVYIFTPDAPLLGNSLYELAVATTALDSQGNPLAAAESAEFLTVMDRTERNVLAEPSLGLRVDLPPLALPEDGTAFAAAEAPSARATQKLIAATQDPLRRPVSGTVISVRLQAPSGLAQTAALAAPATLVIDYADGGNGSVAGADPSVRAKTLALYRLDEKNDIWVRLPSTVDTVARRVTAPIGHVGVFALLSQSDADLSTAHPFPVPWTPRSAPAGITFTGLSQGARLRIYTVSGALVREASVSDLSGQWLWDVRDEQGTPAATGVYYYDITSGEERVSGKLAVVR